MNFFSRLKPLLEQIAGAVLVCAGVANGQTNPAANQLPPRMFLSFICNFAMSRSYSAVLWVVGSLVYFGLVSAGQADAAPNHNDAATQVTDDAALAPYINATTLLVVRADLSNVDLAAWDAWGRMLIDATTLREDDRRFARDWIKAHNAVARQWVKAFKKAGGKSIYWVLNNTDPGRLEYRIIPIETGSDVEALKRLAADPAIESAGPMPLLGYGRKTFGFEDRSAITAKVFGKAIIAGNRTTLDSVRKLIPSLRPEFAQALQRAGTGPFKIVIVTRPPAFFMMLPDRLPDSLGGGSGDILVNGVQWIAMSMDTPPAVALHAMINSKDDHSSKALHEVIGKAIKLQAGTAIENGAALVRARRASCVSAAHAAAKKLQRGRTRESAERTRYLYADATINTASTGPHS